MKDLDYSLAAKVIFIGILVTIFGQNIIEYISSPGTDLGLIYVGTIIGTIYWVQHKQVDLLVSILATFVVILVLWSVSIAGCKEDYYEHIAMLAFEGSPAGTDNYHTESYEEMREIIYRYSPCSDNIASEIVNLYRNW